MIVKSLPLVIFSSFVAVAASWMVIDIGYNKEIGLLSLKVLLINVIRLLHAKSLKFFSGSLSKYSPPRLSNKWLLFWELKNSNFCNWTQNRCDSKVKSGHG